MKTHEQVEAECAAMRQRIKLRPQPHRISHERNAKAARNARLKAIWLSKDAIQRKKFDDRLKWEESVIAEVMEFARVRTSWDIMVRYSLLGTGAHYGLRPDNPYPLLEWGLKRHGSSA